jgi:hypothetical protein
MSVLTSRPLEITTVVQAASRFASSKRRCCARRSASGAKLDLFLTPGGWCTRLVIKSHEVSMDPRNGLQRAKWNERNRTDRIAQRCIHASTLTVIQIIDGISSGMGQIALNQSSEIDPRFRFYSSMVRDISL